MRSFVICDAASQTLEASRQSSVGVGKRCSATTPSFSRTLPSIQAENGCSASNLNGTALAIRSSLDSSSLDATDTSARSFGSAFILLPHAFIHHAENERSSRRAAAVAPLDRVCDLWSALSVLRASNCYNSPPLKLEDDFDQAKTF